MRPLGSPSPEAGDTCNKKLRQAQLEAGTTGTRARPPVHKGVEPVFGEVHQNICSGSILQKTPCLEQLKLEEAEIWTRLWEEVGGG